MSSPAAGGCQSSLVSFVPQEEMLQRLMAMGVTRNAATRVSVCVCVGPQQMEKYDTFHYLFLSRDKYLNKTCLACRI